MWLGARGVEWGKGEQEPWTHPAVSPSPDKLIKFQFMNLNLEITAKGDIGKESFNIFLSYILFLSFILFCQDIF